jgi:ATP phosphoribosyltransferase
MVLAVPQDSPVESARDIKPGSRITTEFPRTTKAFFDDLGIDVEVFFSYGATEAKVPEMMDALVDLTETGSTLRRNGLKIVDVILTSTTRLCSPNPDSVGRSRQAPRDRGDPHAAPRRDRGTRPRPALDERRARQARRRDRRAARDEAPDRQQALRFRGLRGHTVADKCTVNVLIPALKAAGAEDILEFPISKIVR